MLFRSVRSVGEEAIDPCIPRRHTPCTQHDARRQNQFFHRLRKSSVHTPTARKKTEKRWRRKLILISTGIRNSLGIKQTTSPRSYSRMDTTREDVGLFSSPVEFSRSNTENKLTRFVFSVCHHKCRKHIRKMQPFSSVGTVLHTHSLL